jgi:hypothetical protein
MSATRTPPALSPVEYVRSLSAEDREVVFLMLLEEVIAEYPDQGLIPVHQPDDNKLLGFVMSPDAAGEYFRRYGPKLTDEQLAELDRRHANPGKSLTTEELLERLRAEDPSPTR